MGSLGSGTSSLLVILGLQLLLLLSQSKSGLIWKYYRDSPRIVEANFKYKLINDPIIIVEKTRNLTSPWTLPPDALTPSITLRDEQPCVKVALSVNASGLPVLRGFDVNLLEISNNGFRNFRILKRNSTPKEDWWKVEYDCWRVQPAQYIRVSLQTIPYYGISISKQLYVASGDKAPDFEYRHLEEEKRITVSLPQRQDAYARLCYQRNVCEDLEGSTKKLVGPSQLVSLPYEDLLPCLCIEVFYTYRNSRRKQKCPFEKHPERYAANLLKVSATKIKYHVNTMTAIYKSPCREMPEVYVCRKEKGICETIPDADVEERHGRYSIVSIDCDPHLCFKFTMLNSTFIKCPHREDKVWSVTMEPNLSHIVLHVSSHVPAATFSAAICDPVQSTSACATQLPVYNFSSTHHTKEKRLSLPWPGLGRCIQVWRSDVDFAHKRVTCSFDYSHKHLGLISLVAMLVVFAVILLLFLSCRRIWKIFTAPLWRRTILLVYSPDSAEYKTFICAFADFLQSILGCEVILDMWDMNTVSQIGMIAWFYQKRELVSRRKGKVMIVWTQRTKSMYHQWMSRTVNNSAWKDPANLFGAAMSCLNKDLAAEQSTLKLKEYSIVYFEGLCERKDIPRSLKKISKFRLFKDLYRLVSRLQDSPCLSPPCLIKAAAKYLIRKLIRSEKRQGLQEHIELCKQKLLEGVNLEKNKMPLVAL